MKNMLQRIKSSVDEAEDHVSNLGGKKAENTQSEQQKERKIQKMRIL